MYIKERFLKVILRRAPKGLERLARDAVHTAMRGYTGVCVGPIHNIIVLAFRSFTESLLEVVMPSCLIASRGGSKRVS